MNGVFWGFILFSIFSFCCQRISHPSRSTLQIPMWLMKGIIINDVGIYCMLPHEAGLYSLLCVTVQIKGKEFL